MKKILYIVAIFFLISIGCPAAKDSAVVQYEQSTVLPERNFDKQKLAEAKANPAFKYDLTRKVEEPSLLDKILYKIISFIISVLFNPTGSAESILFYIICTALIVGLIFVILRMNAVGIFSRSKVNKKNGLDFSESIEDINALDFDKLIDEAVKAGMYRRAVRLYYLKSLKQLSDRSLISWEINKTNRDYLYELKTPALRSGFEAITYVYEYVWYGNTELDAEKFYKVKSTFHQFYTQTSSAK